MAVKISHASIDENGRIAGGREGDQSSKEVCIRDFYNGGWNLMLRPKTNELAEKSANFTEQICANSNIGYDQNNRNSLYKYAKEVSFDGAKIKNKCECDCSSFMHVAAIAGGANITYGSNGATTRTLRTVLGKSGYYEIYTDSKYLTSDKYLKRGDILVKEGAHTVMVLENGSAVASVQNPVVSAPAPKPTTNTSTKPAKVNVTYAVRIEGGKVLPAVKNLTDYAGIENKKITGIAMKVDKGTIKYQVHVLGGGWLPWVTGYNWKDHNNGYAGNGRPIDAIRVYYSTPSDLVKNGGYREAKYRISPIGSTSYYAWQLDDLAKNGMDGYAGAFGKAIDKVQIDIV